jgi:hypothetical protein
VNGETKINKTTRRYAGMTLPEGEQEHTTPTDTSNLERNSEREHSISMQAFIQNLENARIPLSSQQWQRTELLDLTSLLSSICKLEHQDPSFFLPQGNVSFRKFVGKISENTSYVFSHNFRDSDKCSRASIVLPAYYTVDSRGHTTTSFFAKDQYEGKKQDMETLFLGEYYVSIFFS